MIESFGDLDTESIFRGLRIRGLHGDIQERARRKLRMINQARIVQDLQIPPGNRLEPLRGDLAGFWSIWLGLQSEHDLEVAERAHGKAVKRQVTAMCSVP